MSDAAGRRVLVPVGDSVTMRETVAYTVEDLLTAAEGEPRPELHFVYPASWDRRSAQPEATEEATELLDRVRTWAQDDVEALLDDEGADGPVEAGDRPPVEVSTAVIGQDRYLFSPGDYADVLLAYAREHDLDRVVLDPEYQPGSRATLLTPLEAELSIAEGITYEEAPVERTVRGRRILGRTADLRTLLTTFGLAFGFYLLIGGFAGTFDVATGAVSAAIVALVLSGVTFDSPVRPLRAVRVGARWIVYTPYLLWEITKANFQVAYVVLHPSLPIDPDMVRIEPALPYGLPVTTLANSITLTPGTVTVDVRDRGFYVHHLTAGAREALLDGGLERAVRFVFFGRAAARLPSPRERGQGERPEPPAGTEAPAAEPAGEVGETAPDEGGERP